ncbi:MAG: conserved protein/domain typically associated with flavoprotein oxygenase, DIM6/NTAB family [Treponema sp. CETP13]|nr:MAG: conserved protein/domain typically associated with flavoprotein oxygenase, DIM6/NTAB family [Treponema sp. CETP13]
MKEIEVFDYSNDIMKELQKGILITTKKDGKVNSMTVSWGHLGIEWGKPIFVCYIRTGRYTHQMLDSGEFTVNIPLDRDKNGKLINYCGSHSGRDVDKVKKLGLHLIPGIEVSAPAIQELPLTLECKIIYRQMQESSKLPLEMQEHFYPSDKDSSFGINRDQHEMFFGEIIKAYIAD